jgi:hypothetical protein
MAFPLLSRKNLSMLRERLSGSHVDRFMGLKTTNATADSARTGIRTLNVVFGIPI